MGLFNASPCIRALTQLEQKQVAYVKTELEKYRLNAPWLIDELSVLKIEQFSLLWKEIVDILTHAERRWFYFCDKPEDYTDELYWAHAYKQCEQYDQWLDKLCINKLNELVVYDDKTMRAYRDQLIPLLSYWHNTDFDQEINFKFYSFYFDCVTHIFNECINNGKEEINNDQQFKYFYNQARTCLVTMQKCLQKLSAAQQFPQYLFAYKSLHQIYELLEQEKASIK
jgi:hypothetical protein